MRTRNSSLKIDLFECTVHSAHALYARLTGQEGRKSCVADQTIDSSCSIELYQLFDWTCLHIVVDKDFERFYNFLHRGRWRYLCLKSYIVPASLPNAGIETAPGGDSEFCASGVLDRWRSQDRHT
jgi:hypothetical protein